MAVIIEPDEGNAPEIGQQLLAMAEHYSDVRWVTWPKTGYLVPEELAVKLKKARKSSEKKDEEPAETDDTPDTPRRRPGRPRRNPVQDTDDTEKEE